MKKYLLLALVGTFFITKNGDLERLNKKIKKGNNEAVQELLETESFTPKELRAAYKVAHARAHS